MLINKLFELLRIPPKKAVGLACMYLSEHLLRFDTIFEDTSSLSLGQLACLNQPAITMETMLSYTGELLYLCACVCECSGICMMVSQNLSLVVCLLSGKFS